MSVRASPTRASTRPRTGGARAFSLIEVMAASAMFIVGLTAIFSSFGIAARMFEHQRHTTFAIHLAEASMEDLLLRFSTDSDLTTGTHGPLSYDSNGFVTTAANARYTVNWIVEENKPISRIRTVTARVSWDERGVGQSLAFSTQRN